MHKVSTSVRLNAILRTEIKDLCFANGVSIGKAIETLLILFRSDIDLQQRIFKEATRP